MNTYVRFLCLLGGVLVAMRAVDACNEAVCAPLVSKCMLIKCCECDMSDKKNCSCCRACQVCLAKLYTECCSCVGLCPAPDPEDSLYRTSSIESLPDPIPELFAVLTEEEDFHQRWTTHTYSYNLDSLLFKPGTGYTSELDSFMVDSSKTLTAEKLAALDAVMGVHNCSTAFFAQCMSIAKCKTSCKSMGAAKFRWFHEYGCCQCIGSTCLDYGLNEPHCLQCPAASSAEEGGESWAAQSNDLAATAGQEEAVVKSDQEDAVKLLPDVLPGSV